ncbi:hypothetical protein [Prosthecodimorpha staleyi]|uniref:Uncharacterized protein n=1 Tax=Prosthecodimorpha staleyi TaxID=2840188 RepID=A0A947DAA1_9HYPH|nr:hypothetical protein [Prosthecodimorpha staleyi]MBT9293289.1 hypothetical protein [Prosthecodimorpha staleyi]
MFELAKVKSHALRIAKGLYGHRALYAGLACCHFSGCFLAGKPELYGPMALLYAVLALKS